MICCASERLGFGAAQNQNIGIVVLAAGSRAVEILHQRRADAGKFVCGDRHANAARANQHASLHLSCGNPLRHFSRVIGIVHRLPALRFHSRARRYSSERKRTDKKILKLHAAMVTTKAIMIP